MKKKNLLFASFVVANCGLVSAKQAEKPNIIFILADDMGYGDVSYLDHASKITTENLDEMARNGVVFTDAHTSSSVSTPTRYGVLTGRYNWRSTLKNGVLKGWSAPIIREGRETVASMLRKNGYYTACVGKWHLGWNWAGVENGEANVDYSKPINGGPTDVGFDYYYGIAASLDMPPYVYVENELATALPDHETEGKGKYARWRKGPTAPNFVHEEVFPNIVDKACQVISEKAPSDQPYFIYLPFPAPHTPILPVGDVCGKTGLGPYGDYVLMVDKMVGKVLDAVEKSGEKKNTLIVFTTDNGCSPAADIEDLKSKGHSPNSIYRGHKADLFDGGHRIPCLVQWPAKVKHHEVNQTICLTDFYAAFASIVGYELEDSEAEDSYDILPAILSKKEIAPIREATVHHSFAGEFTIRQGEWKLLLSPSSGGWSDPRPNNLKALAGLPTMQLYNMVSDPEEQHNVALEHPEIVSKLKALMVKYIDEGRSTPGAPQKNDNVDEWLQVDVLKALELKK